VFRISAGLLDGFTDNSTVFNSPKIYKKQNFPIYKLEVYELA